MRVDAFPESAEEYEAAALARYAPAWAIWRSEQVGGWPAAWYATRRDGAAGEPRTLAGDSAGQLAQALAEQADQAQTHQAQTHRAQTYAHS